MEEILYLLQVFSILMLGREAKKMNLEGDECPRR